MATVDLNQTFTTKDVAALLASKDDSQNRQLRVGTDGIAFISDDVGARNLTDIAFRLETWDRGNGYVGAEAANDPEWVARIEAVLRKNWPNPTDSYIDGY